MMLTNALLGATVVLTLLLLIMLVALDWCLSARLDRIERRIEAIADEIGVDDDDEDA